MLISKKLLAILIITTIGKLNFVHAGSSCSTWKISNRCYPYTPTQVISQINNAKYNDSPLFNSCIRNCNANSSWDTSMSSNTTVPYTSCVNQCVISAGFFEVNACGAQQMLEQTRCFGR